MQCQGICQRGWALIVMSLSVELSLPCAEIVAVI